MTFDSVGSREWRDRGHCRGRGVILMLRGIMSRLAQQPISVMFGRIVKSALHKYLGDGCVSWCWLGSNLVNLWRIRAMDPIGLGGGDVDWLSMHASLHVIAATCA